MMTAAILEMIHQRRAGHSLPRDFYVDSAIFELDVERIYRRHWLLAGPSCRIPRAGDYFTFRVANEPLVLLRDDENQVRAFFNVCRHRGSVVCPDEQGHAGRLVCPYHAWSYKLDGSLCAARNLPEGVDTSGLGLHPIHTREVEGLVFICLAETPPDFGPTAREIGEYLRPHGLARTKVARRTVEVIRANWKVVSENFWECYHCAPSHPEFCGVMSYAHAQNNAKLAAERADFERQWTDETWRRGGRTGRVERNDRGLHQGGRLPIRPGFLTQSQDGQPVAPLLGDLTAYDGGITSFQHFPLLWYVISNDHALVTRFTPLAPLETELELIWLVHETAVEGADYDPETVSWLWAVTADQDKTICENNQRGILSSRYQPGPYATTESAADEFVSWYLEELSKP